MIIPTYNWSSVLSFAIRSALGQTFTDFEVLVVGDGCTDDSEAIVQSINDERVRWINLPANTGHQSEPNNEGLRQARGELIAYLGHDDLWLPHHLQSLTAKIAEGFDFVYGLTGMVDLDLTTLQPAPNPPKYERGLWIPPTSVMHRKEIIAKVGGWRHYREIDGDPEIELWERTYDASYRFAFVPRLTAVKFPAACRKDAYKHKSCSEQAFWFERIKNESDLESVELTNMLFNCVQTINNSKRDIRYVDLLRELVTQTCSRALKRFPAMSSNHRPAKGETIAKRRKFKGLDVD